MAEPEKIATFCQKIGENSRFQNFAIKVLNIGLSPCVLLLQKENENSNMFCKFYLHSMQVFFFKMAT